MTHSSPATAGQAFYEAAHALKRALDYPFHEREPADLAEQMACAILYDLSDRGGIKHAFSDLDEAVRVEIVEAHAAIIRTALATQLETKPATVPADVIEAAQRMKAGNYRGPLAWARKVFDWVAAQPAAQGQGEVSDAKTGALKERDDAEEFIDLLLDEVLGADRAEWSNLYGRDEALADVQERMAALMAPIVGKAWDRFAALAGQAQGQGEVSEAVDALRACDAVCERVIDQYHGIAAGVDFHALRKAVRAALAGQAQGEQAADDLLDQMRAFVNLVKGAALQPEGFLNTERREQMFKEAGRLNDLYLARRVEQRTSEAQGGAGDPTLRQDALSTHAVGVALLQAMNEIVAADDDKLETTVERIRERADRMVSESFSIIRATGAASTPPQPIEGPVCLNQS